MAGLLRPQVERFDILSASSEPGRRVVGDRMNPQDDGELNDLVGQSPHDVPHFVVERDDPAISRNGSIYQRVVLVDGGSRRGVRALKDASQEVRALAEVDIHDSPEAAHICVPVVRIQRQMKRKRVFRPSFDFPEPLIVDGLIHHKTVSLSTHSLQRV